jgi:hypothetical protein
MPGIKSLDNWLADYKEKEKAKQDEWDAMSDEDRVFHKLKNPPAKNYNSNSILLPLIRHFTPALIAQNIIGVQPMGEVPLKRVYYGKTDDTNKSE